MIKVNFFSYSDVVRWSRGLIRVFRIYLFVYFMHRFTTMLIFQTHTYIYGGVRGCASQEIAS